MSICSVNEPSLLLVTTEATEYRTGQLMIFEVRDNQELESVTRRLTLVFKCSNITEQSPILPNQIKFEHSGLLERAITDLSVDVDHAITSANQTENIN